MSLLILSVLQLDFEEQQRVRREEFTKLARNMHHLTSTRQIRGVYNPLPFLMPVCYLSSYF